MPGEIITIQAGQCGNQIGLEFWKQICKEHSINNQDGTLIDNLVYPDFSPDGSNHNGLPSREDYPNIFFNQDDENRFTPRGILFDLEPRVVQTIEQNHPNLFNPRNIYTSASGSGAGNNWSLGYDYAAEHMDELLNIIDREVDNCDNLEGFQLVHSVAGGTGSGLGSYLLEQINDRYNKKLVQTYSVFPANNQTSDVVVQPYNTVLSLRRLIECADSCVVFDNGALNSIAMNSISIQDISYNQSNQLVSTVMASITNPLRFPTSMYNSMTSIVSSLIPNPNLHFLIPSFYPYTPEFVDDAKDIRRSTAYDVILELLDRRLKMIQIDDKIQERIISVIDILQGPIDKNDVDKALLRFRQRAKFPNWTNQNINLIYGKKSPYLSYSLNQHQQIIKNKKKIVNGLMLTNSNCVLSLLRKTCSQYDKFIKRNAFLDIYRKSSMFSDNLDEFKESREAIQTVIEEYLSSRSDTYLQEDDDDDFDNDAEVSNDMMDQDVSV